MRTIFIFAGMAFCLGLAEFVMIGMTPALATGLDTDIEQIGDIVGLYGLACAVATPIIALTTSRMQRRRLFIVLALVFNGGNLLSVLAMGYMNLAVSRMMAACTSGPLLAIMLTIVPNIVCEQRRAMGIAIVLGGFTLASVIGIPLAHVLADMLGWKSVYVLVLVLGAGATILAERSLVEPKAPRNNAGIRAQLRLIVDPRVLLNALMILLGAAGVYVLYTYLTPYLEDTLGLEAQAASAALLAIGIAGAASNFLSGVVANRFGRISLPIIYLMIAVLLGGSTVLVHHPMIAVIAVFFACLLMYVMNSIVQLIFLDVAASDCPQAATLASSLHPTAFNAGIALGSFVGGVVVGDLGLFATGAVGGALALVAAVCAVALLRVLGAKSASRARGVYSS